MPVKSLLTTRYWGGRGEKEDSVVYQDKFLGKVQQLSVIGLLCQLTRGKKTLKTSSFSGKGFSPCISYLSETLYFSTTNPILQESTLSALRKREDLFSILNNWVYLRGILMTNQ